MSDKFEGLIRQVYRKWKMSCRPAEKAHPDEEAVACFFEGRLPAEEARSIQSHLIHCSICAEAFVLQFKAMAAADAEVPKALIEKVKQLSAEDSVSLLEVVLRLKGKMIELVNTTADVLVGQEFMPAPLLRSRKLQEFSGEITILKDFFDIRAEIKVENKQHGFFNLIVTVKEKESQKIIRDLRISLLKEGEELESYISASGPVSFEHVSAGSYAVWISGPEKKLACISLEIKE